MGQLISGIARGCDVQGELPFPEAGGTITATPEIKPNFLVDRILGAA